ncbi:MAG: hypothetical protein ACRDPV_06665 [Gaiellaceae bacterium]
MTIAPAPIDAEYLEAQLSFHLNAGVDLVIATADDASEDVSEILEQHGRQGHLVRAPDGLDPSSPEQRAQTSRLAATEYAADWLITATSTEFWWPRGASLKDVLVAVPPRYGIVQALVRQFRPRPGTDLFAERMIVRDSLASASPGQEPLLHLLSPVQRLSPGIGVHGGQPLRAWYPIEVLRFPLDHTTDPIPEEAVAQGIADGSLAVDERLRDVLRTLHDGSGYRLPSDDASSLAFAVTTVVDDAKYAVECAAIGEVDLDRLDRQIRDLEGRIALLEQRFWPRALRAASQLAHGRIRRHS